MSEMHAGDALWFLHAGLTYFKEQLGDRGSIEYLRECVRIIGAHIDVPEPFDSDAETLLQTLRMLDTPGVDDTSQKASTKKGDKWSDPDRIEHAKTLLDAMVSSDLFDWAEMVRDIHEKVNGANPFVTNKQFRGLVNVANKGEYEDGASFWDVFDEEYSETARFVHECADGA